MQNKKLVALIAAAAVAAIGLTYTLRSENDDHHSKQVRKENHAINKILHQAKRIQTSEKWFEIIKLPNDVYALYEPGHTEKVNSYLIIGSEKDLLFDTGMGIASIKRAIYELRNAEGLPNKELIVVNSHSHLDHRGGNSEFDDIYVYNSQWSRQKQTSRIQPGEWRKYYASLSGKPKPPRSFRAKSFTFPPTKDSQLHYLKSGDTIDLGNRKFVVYITRSHTPDSIVLHEPKQELLFSGDAFGADGFLVRDIDLLAIDLHMLEPLPVKYHYVSHGQQLIAPGLRKEALAAMDQYQEGNYKTGKISFAGRTFPVYKTEGFSFGFAPCLMMQA